MSFSCDSSSIAGGGVQWVGPLPRGDGVSHPAGTFNKPDISLAVSPGGAGDYQCSPHGDQTTVLARVRLHTLRGKLYKPVGLRHKLKHNHDLVKRQ